MANQNKNAIDEMLAEALKEISATRPVEKITIKQITDRAGVIRPTFYNHFQDKYELVEWIVKTELIEPLTESFKSGNYREVLINTFGRMEEEKNFYMRAAAIEGQNSFDSILRTSIRGLLLNFINIDRIQKNLPFKWLTVDMMVDFYSESLSYLVSSWIHAGMKEPKDELSDVIIFVMFHSPAEMAYVEKDDIH